MFCDSLKYMRLLRGRKIADKILADLKKAIQKQKSKPALAVLLVGENKASRIYASLKQKAAQRNGIGFYLYEFSKNSSEKEIIGKIKELNGDKKISGIIVQLPLPKKFSAQGGSASGGKTQKIINAISPEKDADGFSAQGGPAGGRHPQKNSTSLQPVFPKAILKLIESSGQKIAGKRAIVVANSKKFGETMVAALKQKKIRANYILAKEIKNNLAKLKKADMIITAVGKPDLITGDMVKKNVVIIDGGIIKKGKKVLGDVDFESVKNKVSYITPVPGGVGPVTIACLLENVYLLSKKSR